jgi:hypothetical protein
VRINTMFGLLVWARRQAGINENAAAQARMRAIRILMIAGIVTLLSLAAGERPR